MATSLKSKILESERGPFCAVWRCTGFAWDRVHFLPSSSEGAVFWSVTGAVLVTHQFGCCWAEGQGFPFVLLCCLSGLGVCKKLRRDTARRADPKGPGDIPWQISCTAKFPNYREGALGEVGTAQRVLSIGILDRSKWGPLQNLFWVFSSTYFHLLNWL